MVEILQNFALGFQPYSILILSIGVIAGIMIGALPGLTATMGVTLLLPFTFGMKLSPQDSMAMLIGIYVGAIYGGSITAILIATPGTPASAATMLDGFPLTQRGESGRAIILATIATFVGGIIGTIVLVFMSPLLSRFALYFSYPEYFALAVFGLSMIISISGTDVIKGLISGVFGLMLATIGLDPTTGVSRFTFGIMELYEGIGFIPVLIGLFAFAQVFGEIADTARSTIAKAKFKYQFPSIREIFRYWWLYIYSGLLGTYIGTLPGAGCDIASFVGYNEAKRFSRTPERFGHGAPEGIIAPEAAKSGCTSGAMIPMMTLGVPGDAVTAVMLSGLIMQGLQPGPLLFKDHPDVVYPIFAFMFISYFVTVIVGLTAAPYLAKIVMVKKSILFPIICVLSVMGAYAIRYSLFDVYVAIIMGAIGYGMRRWGIPASPIVLALILGPMAEKNLRNALLLSDGNISIFFTKPISAILLLLAISSIIYGFIKSRRSATLPPSEM